MRNITLALLLTGFALALFIFTKPQDFLMYRRPGPCAELPPEELVVLEPLTFFTIAQGESKHALTLNNTSGRLISFNLAHDHPYLKFEPNIFRLYPEANRDIFISIDPKCSIGEINLPVLLEAKIDNVRFDIITKVNVEVIAGELTLECQDGCLHVLWNGGPTPCGVIVFYRIPGEEEWRLWGQTPHIEPPVHLEPGYHEFEFKAQLGEVASEIETLEVLLRVPDKKKLLMQNNYMYRLRLDHYQLSD